MASRYLSAIIEVIRRLLKKLNPTNSSTDQPRFLFDTQKPWAVMQIHQGRSVARLHKIFLKLVKENGLIRPGVLSSLFLKQAPLPLDLGILGKDRFFGLIAQEHFTDNGLKLPSAPIFSQIDAFKTGVRFLEDRY